MPKISVILSSYNHEKYIAASIESVLSQTFSDFELLIFDDGSSDASQKIIRSFDDPRIKLFLYEKNRGPYYAIQEPLKSARGEYLAFQHSDDIWEPEKLSAQVEFLDAHEEYAVCFTQVKFIDETGAPYDLPETHPYRNIFRQKNRSREEWLNHLFWHSNCFCNPSMLARNDAENFSLNPCMMQLPDYFMWVKLCARRNVCVLERELIKFRLRRAEQESVSSISLEKMVRAANETNFMAREFLFLLRDKKEFLAVFPEAQEFSRGGQIDIEFAFAQLCLRHKLPAYHEIALELLYKLLTNPKKAAAIKKIYGYDSGKFIQDTGKFDVFGVRNRAPTFDGKLYLNLGGGFSENDTITNAILIRPDGRFSATFTGALKGEVSEIRFDPDDSMIPPMKIFQILINGESAENFSSNAFYVVEGFHVFLNADPWFVIAHRVSAPELRVEISGVIERNALPVVERAFAEQPLAEIKALQKKLQERDEEISALRGEMEAFLSLRSVKLARRLHSLKESVKKMLR